jgi:DNA-binding CsgD family transcriptional regulator
MHSAAAWTAGVLSLANAGLATAVLVPLHRARRAGQLDHSLIASRVGLTIEVGLGVYVGAALLRGSLAISAAVGVDAAQTAVQNWGMISGSASVLILLVAVRWYLTPLLNSLQRSQRALKVMLGAFEPGSLDPEDLDLSTREQEVLAVIAAGKVSDQEIADTLFISAATAATHVRNILKKAGLHDRRQLVLIGLQDPPR